MAIAGSQIEAGGRLQPTRATPTVVGICAATAGLLCWELVAAVWFDPVALPRPSVVAVHGLSLLWSGDSVLGASLLEHVLASLGRILTGFLLGSVLGAAVAYLMGSIPLLHRFLDPIVNFVRFIPPIAWISPFLIWFGIGEVSKVALIVYTVGFMVLLNTLAGVLAVDPVKRKAAACMGAGSLGIFRWVILPASLSYVLDGMRIAIGNAFVTIVAAEMIAAQTGLGYLILVSRNFGGTDVIFLAMFILGALGFCADRMFVYLSSRCAGRYYTR